MAHSAAQPLILLVEDDVFLAAIYERRFEIDGYKIIIARDGEAGLAAACSSEKPACILLDILLPKLDGISVLKKLKKNQETQSIPVFLLTNLSHRAEEEEGLKIGAAGYLIKAHFKPSEIVNRVRQELNKKI